MRRAPATSVRSRPHETAPARRGGASPRAEAEEEGPPGQECAWERAQPARLPEEAGRDAEDERGHPEGLAGRGGRGRVASAPHARTAASPPRAGPRDRPLAPRGRPRRASPATGGGAAIPLQLCPTSQPATGTRSSTAFRERDELGREMGFVNCD